MKLYPLTPEESAVLLDKKTERPCSGEYDNFFKDGVYVCRRCHTPLYRSTNKFDAHCGWPAFDDEIAGAVLHVPDGDRTEAVCATCSAHLGHIFEGEHFTETNVRHCINSLSMKFIPSSKKT